MLNRHLCLWVQQPRLTFCLFLKKKVRWPGNSSNQLRGYTFISFKLVILLRLNDDPPQLGERIDIKP